MENEDEKQTEDLQQQQQKKKMKNSAVIKIPSYQEVLESSQPNPPSLFRPSSSFSQAFSFVKDSEFYIPPPPPSTTSPSALPPDTTASRQSSESEVPSSSRPSSSSAGLAFSAPPVQGRNAILVSHRQKGNPLLKHIRNVRWTFADIVCDYLLGQNSCALYLSLRYHLLHPDYLYYRIKELQKNFKLRIVLCHVDVEDVVKPLREVTRTALLHDCTLLCGWSLEECGRYLETIKIYENKSADLIQGYMDTDYLSRLTHALTTVRHVNKTDVVTLGSTFGSLSRIMDASMEDLALCPGIGERKVKRLHDTFHEPFKRVVSCRPAVPKDSVQENAKPSSADEATEIEKEAADESTTKKVPSLTVKSALTAAFAKYSDKVRRKDPSSSEKGEETNVASEANDENQ